MSKGLAFAVLAAVALAAGGCTNNPQTNKEMQCAGGVLGGAAIGGLLGNQIGGGTGKDRSRQRSARAPARRSARRRGLPVGPAGSVRRRGRAGTAPFAN